MKNEKKKNVNIGDKYKKRGDNNVYTVVDFRIVTSFLTGEIVGSSVVSCCQCMGQIVYDYDVPFATVVRGRIDVENQTK